MEQKPHGLALLPLALFLVLFIGTGSILSFSGVKMAFYELSPAVAILPALALALIMGHGGLSKKINIMLAGAGEINIITMCIIYLLAGGFASVAKAIGGVDATVNLGLSLIPAEFILPGLFLIAAFVSTAMGTSMGTIAAVGPIAVGIGQQTDIGLAMLMGSVVGGAMFGDNLSMISDTTIAATRTQGCEMGDKFRMNLLIALPAAVGATLLFWLMGDSGQAARIGAWEMARVLPYVVILAMALAGMNVFVVLFTGIVLAGGVGVAVVPGYSVLQWAKDIYAGFSGMHEILVLSMLMGGLGELIRYQGGLAWLLDRIGRMTSDRRDGRTRRLGEAGISLLVSLANLCTANNTVAIILTGGMARGLAETNGVDPRRSASMLDIFSCVVQGLIPYGAQVLLAGSIAGISPVDVSLSNMYCYLLGVTALASIALGLPKGGRRAA